jgi:hypothetical protein
MTIGGLSNIARDNILGRNAQWLFGIHKLPEPARLLHSPAYTSVEGEVATNGPLPNSDQNDAVGRIS